MFRIINNNKQLLFSSTSLASCLRNGDAVCLLFGTNWMLRNCVAELSMLHDSMCGEHTLNLYHLSESHEDSSEFERVRKVMLT